MSLHHHVTKYHVPFAAIVAMVAMGASLFATSGVFAALPQGYGPGTYFKCSSGSTVYYITSNSKRTLFPDLPTYRSWFPLVKNKAGRFVDDYSKVKILATRDCSRVLGELPYLGKVITIKPGSNLVKFAYNPKIYAVTSNGLRWVEDTAILRSWYPSSNAADVDAGWGGRVVTVPDQFAASYSFVSSITAAGQFNPDEARGEITTPDQVVGLPPAVAPVVVAPAPVTPPTAVPPTVAPVAPPTPPTAVTVPGNESPRAFVTWPENNSSYRAPTSIQLYANGLDSDGQVTRVEFFDGATLIGQSTAAPFGFIWANVPVGTHSIVARATDNGGGQGMSAVVTITVIGDVVTPPAPVPPTPAPVNTPPTVSLTAPAANASFTAPATVTISANASDSNGSVTQVEFFSGDTRLLQDTAAPYTYTWSSVPAGTYSVTARATDNGGAQMTSNAVTVTVSAPTPPPTPPTPTPTPLTPSPSGSLSNYRSAIGTNTHSLSDFGANWIYTDLFKSARPWVSGERFACWDCGPVLDLDADGWVRSLRTTGVGNGGHVARTPILTNVTGGSAASYYPTGRYTVIYDGEGTIAYRGATRNDALSRAGRDVIDVTNSGVDTSVIIQIEATNANNYIRNIRVYPPGGSCSNDQTQSCTTNTQCGSGNSCRIFADTPNPQRFHPTYLRNNRSTSVVRLMQEFGTNEVGIENVVNPSDYTRLSNAVWFRMPGEIIGELANALQSDIWVNIPVNASDALVRDLATRIRSTINSHSRVFVEYSNESWNGAYPYILQQQILAARGCQNNPDLQAGCDQDVNPGNRIYCENHPWPTYNQSCATAEMRQFSDRTVQVGQIFREVFGANGRVIRVMGSHTGNTYRSGILLSWRNNGQNIDALATAPYFGNRLSSDPAVQSMSLNTLFSRLQDVELPLALNEIRDDIAFLRQSYPAIDLIAYEGGQHLIASGPNDRNSAAMTLFSSANNDPRMGTLYTTYLNGWRTRGGKTFAHFVDVSPHTPYGYFGALLSQEQPHSAAPKFMALENFALETPCWWTGCEFGGSWVGRGGSSGTTPPPAPPTPTPTPPTPPPANTPPTVSLTAPAPNASFTAPATITISANAADSNGSVTQVEFFNGATRLGEDNSAPYSFSWANVAAGTYSVTARATDNGGAQTTSNALTITVGQGANVLPTVSLTAPSANASFTAPATISFAANAADSDGTITRVEFYNGSTRLGEDTTAPYTFTWSNVPAGSYSVNARTTDNRGGLTTSASVSVTVSAAPTPPPTPPTPTPTPPTPPPSSGGAISVSLQPTRTSGPAPLAVLFDATDTSISTAGVNAFQQLTYEFNFGDDRGLNWSTSGQSKNIQRGSALAAHVFDNPGTYTVRLRVTGPNGESAERTTTITVQETNAAWPGTQTICVSPSANYAGCPTGATQQTSLPTSYDGRRVLLRRGESFGRIAILHTDDRVMIATYGTGPKPQVVAVRVGEGRPANADFPDEITVMDLDVADGIIHQNSGSRLLFYRNDLDDAPSTAYPRPNNAILVGDGIWYWATNSPAVPASQFTTPREAFIVENRILGTAPYSQTILHNIHGIMSRTAIMGNEIGGAVEHSIRFFETYKTFVAHNAIQGRHVDAGRSAIKLHSGGTTPFTDVFNGFASRYVVIANNIFGHAQDTSQWLVQIAQQNREGHAGVEGIEDVVLENNRFVRNSQTTIDVALVGRRLGTRGNTSVNASGASVPFRAVGETTNELGSTGYILPAEWKGPYFIQ